MFLMHYLILNYCLIIAYSIPSQNSIKVQNIFFIIFHSPIIFTIHFFNFLNLLSLIYLLLNQMRDPFTNLDFDHF